MADVSRTMTFEFVRKNESWTDEITLNALIVAGWTGRDHDAVEHHIKELEAIGVQRPAKTPIFYRIALSRLTEKSTIEVLGETSSGEVEFVLMRHQGELWVGLASDHTDRDAERHGVSLSKQMCDKPIANTLWAYDDLKDHWDELILSASIGENGQEVLYQKGAVSAMLTPKGLLRKLEVERDFDDGAAMLCGTHGVIGALRHADIFKMQLVDPVLNRKIEHSYAVQELPVLG